MLNLTSEDSDKFNVKSLIYIILFYLLTIVISGCSHHRDVKSNHERFPSQVYDSDKVKVPKYLQKLLFAEQLLIDRSVDEQLIMPPTITGQGVQYRPESQQWFKVKSIWIPEDDLQIAEIPNSFFHNSKFIKKLNGKRYFKFLIHPESEIFYKKLIDKYKNAGNFLATSTSSSRTVLVTDQKGSFFFAKLSLDVELGGVVRTIPKSEVARSVGLTQYTDDIQSPNQSFQIIREPLGINPKGFDRGGQILREIPKEAFKNGKTLVPLFSLYSTASGKNTLLKKMISGQKDPINFIKQKILAPFAKAWIDWAVDADLVMEAHAQNVLIQLDKNGLPTGKFYHRDLGGFNADFSNYDTTKLPYFTSITEDYHLKFNDQAITQSLRVYFEGGFLFNVNNELKRLGHKSIDLRIYFRELIIKEFKNKTQTNMRGVTTNNLYNSLSNKIRRLRTTKQHFLGTCPSLLLKMIDPTR